jgi:1-acyl-sn-glycerol-3-phosphate acyltransferase
MIPARKHEQVVRWFRGYTRRYLRRSFNRVLVAGERVPAPEGPLLVCLNHSSWWDMLIAFWLSHDYLGWDGYGPMDERQLRRYGILSRIGVFGVDRESLQGGRDFLEYARRLLSGHSRALWITAQGAMVSTDERPIRLYSGIARLAESLGSCHVTTVALQYEFWDEKRPEALVSLGPLRKVEAGDGFSSRGFLRELEADLEHRMDGLDRLRRGRDASLFRVALSGSSGISPAYDLFRRITGGLRGKAFDAGHGTVVTAPRRGPARPRAR